MGRKVKVSATETVGNGLYTYEEYYLVKDNVFVQQNRKAFSFVKKRLAKRKLRKIKKWSLSFSFGTYKDLFF